MFKFIKKLFGKKEVTPVEVQPVVKPKRAYKKRQPKVESPVTEAVVESIAKCEPTKKEVSSTETPEVSEVPTKKARKSKKA